MRRLLQIKRSAISYASSPSTKSMNLRRSRRAIVPPSRDEGGFTLVELMIAAAITVVIVLVLGGMFLSLMNTSMRASQRIDAFRDARAALQTIERDFANLIQTQWQPDPFASPTPTPGTAQPVTRPAAYFALENIYTDPAAGNQQLYGLVAVKTAGSPTPAAGDVCAVGYYCRWDDQLHAYSLRRFFRPAASSGTCPPNSLSTLEVFKSVASYASDSDLYSPSACDEVLAAYVWNFNVIIYKSDGTQISTYPYICDPSPTTPNLPPSAIEISFNAMSPQAARTVMSVSSSPNDWMNTTTTNYQRLILPHMYQFRTRINLQ